jgi:hypothetical protein
MVWRHLGLEKEGFAVFDVGETFFGEFSEVIIDEEVPSS